MAKRPDWVMKSWTALNIKEFILFDILLFFFLSIVCVVILYSAVSSYFFHRPLR